MSSKEGTYHKRWVISVSLKTNEVISVFVSSCKRKYMAWSFTFSFEFESPLLYKWRGSPAKVSARTLTHE